VAIKFTVDHDHTYEGDDGEEQLVGWIHFTVTTKAGDFRSRDGSGSPKTVRIPRRSGWLASDGHLYADATSGEPMRLVANDPEFNLDHVTYRVDFELTTLLGEPVDVPHTFFPAPSTDTTVHLTRFVKDPDQTVMEVRSKCYVEDIIDLNASTLVTDFNGVSDFDFRLDDTRTPTDGSVSAAKLQADLASVLGLLSGGDPDLLRLGLAPDGESAASQVEVYTGDDDPPSRRARWDSSGSFRQFGAIWQGLDDSEGTNYFLNGAAGTFRGFQFLSAGLPRWIFGVSVDAESGGDAGSKFQIRSRHDDGTDKTVVVSIDRATDVATLAGALVTLASSTTRAGLNVPPGTAPTAPVNGDVWSTTSGVFARIDGATVQFAPLVSPSFTTPTLGTVAGGDVSACTAVTAATASKIAQRDSNGNLFADAFIPSVTSTATAAGTTTLSIDSTAVQVFTGSTTQTVKLPTTSVTAGTMFIVSNQSSGTVTVQSSGASTVCDVRAGRVGIFVAQKDTPTAAADWWPFVPTTSSVASTIVQRDSNAMIISNGLATNAESTATAAGTTTLAVGSNPTVQVFTGSTTQTVKLPTSSVTAGQMWTVCNQSSGTVTVQSSGANTIDTVAGGTVKLFVAVKANPTAAADWRAI